MGRTFSENILYVDNMIISSVSFISNTPLFINYITISDKSQWSYTPEALRKSVRRVRTSIGSALKELERSVYIVRNRLWNSKGKIMDVEYVVYEIPRFPEPDGPDEGTPDQSCPDTEKPDEVLPTTQCTCSVFIKTTR